MSEEATKKVILEFLRLGNRQDAIDYAKEVYQVNDAEAEKLIAALESNTPEPSNPSQTGQGCAGCFGVVFKMVSVFFAFISIMMLSAVAFLHYVIAEEKKALVEVEAEVIELSKRQIDKIHPVVQYEWDGRKYTDTIDFSVEPDEYEVGQMATVFIHPNHPEKAYLEKDMTISFIATFIEGDVNDVSDIQVLDLIKGGITFILLIPGLFFLVLSIIFWQIGRRMSS